MPCGSFGKKKGSQLSLQFTPGGADKSFEPIVSCLRPGGIAHRSDCLQVGDRLVAVNGIKLTNLKHGDVLTLLRNAGDTIQLDVEYSLDEMYFQRPACTFCRVTNIVLDKEGGSAGFSVRGGSYGPDAKKSRPITVSGIRPGGPADREGRLRIGDRILSINGVDVCSAMLQTAQRHLRDASPSVSVTVEYDVSILETVKEACGPLLLEIDKPSGMDLGLELGFHNRGPNGKSLTIDDIRPASIADRCGALHIGDQLISIDGTSLEYTTLAEANQLLRGSSYTGSQIRLEVMPSISRAQILDQNSGPLVRRMDRSCSRSRKPADSSGPNADRKNHHMHNGSAMDKSQGRTERARHSRERSQDSADINNRNNNNKQRIIRAPPSYQQSFSAEKAFHQRRNNCGGNKMSDFSDDFIATSRSYSSRVRKPSQSSMSGSMSGVPSGQVCHSEVMEVTLNSWRRGGFGLILHRSHVQSEHGRAPLFISYIEKGSPAEKSGVLQVGDRILALNDWCTGNGTAEEANYIVRHASSPLTLTVEFDVIETVLPTSGIFTVKLAKRAQNLGVVISSDEASHKGEPVIVSDIRTGSVAHRCGSIQPGDQLLAIDNIPLDSCSVEESVRLLQRSTDIVKLRVKKSTSGMFMDDEPDSAPQTVVYSVELSRRGGPLGITIASTDERGDPVIISQLAPAGLADRTGALHVGDRLLAINGQSLQGKRVSEAMQMLQMAGETVNLKIARYVDPPFHYQAANQHRLGHGPTGTSSGYPDNYILSEQDSSDKLGTPVQSVDSAVESLEDSPIAEPSHPPQSIRNLHHSKTGSITGDQAKYAEELSVHLQKSLSSLSRSGPPPLTSILKNAEASSLASSSGQQSSDHGGDSGIASEAGTSAEDNFCGCTCQQNQSANTSSEPQEEWIRVLEALETVGEEEMLRKLEESIMKGSVPSSDPKSRNSSSSGSHSKGSLLNPPFPVMTDTILRHPPHFANNVGGFQDNCMPSTSASGPCPAPPPKPPFPYGGVSCSKIGQQNIPTLLTHSQSQVHELESHCAGQLYPISSTSEGSSTPSSIQLSGGTPTPSGELQLSTGAVDAAATTSDDVSSTLTASSAASSSLPLEIVRVSLAKDRGYNDFGFSVSDGANAKGVYINKIRPGGPAQLSGMIKPFDQILQVNNTSLQELDCLLAVPLLLSAADRVDLLLSRDPSLTAVGLRLHESIAEEDDISLDVQEATV